MFIEMKQECEVKELALEAAYKIDKDNANEVKHYIECKLRTIMDKERAIRNIAYEIKVLKAEVSSFEMMDVPEAHEKIMVEREKNSGGNYWFVSGTTISS